MLLLSLGPEAVAALLCAGEGERREGPFAGPDLAWLLFGPEMGDEAQDTAPVVTEMLRIRASG
jgi:hypothetical protein